MEKWQLMRVCSGIRGHHGLLMWWMFKKHNRKWKTKGIWERDCYWGHVGGYELDVSSRDHRELTCRHPVGYLQ